jgi:hypothetical protein
VHIFFYKPEETGVEIKIKYIPLLETGMSNKVVNKAYSVVNYLRMFQNLKHLGTKMTSRN